MSDSPTPDPLEAIPRRDDWEKPRPLADGMFGIGTMVFPCGLCGAQLLFDRNAIDRHGEWHDKHGDAKSEHTADLMYQDRSS